MLVCNTHAASKYYAQAIKKEEEEDETEKKTDSQREIN